MCSSEMLRLRDVNTIRYNYLFILRSHMKYIIESSTVQWGQGKIFLHLFFLAYHLRLQIV